MARHVVGWMSVLGVALVAGTVASAADWPTAGHDLKNSRYQEDEKSIDTKTVAGLKLRWSFDTDGDVTANPAVDGEFLYFPDSAGFLYKVDRRNGNLVWKNPISNYTGIAGDFARATPAVAGDLLILGNQSGKFLGTAFGQPAPQPARVFAVNKVTGAAVWSTQVDDTPLSFVTHSAVIANGTVFVGTASNEELVAAFVPKLYWQWNFRGSIVALDVATGGIKWKTYMVPAGYYGGSVWGSTGAIDLKSNQFFVATGNNYAVPQGVLDCISAGGSQASCSSPDNHFDSIVALDLTTGAINWAGRGLSSDTWNVACGLNAPGFEVGPWFPGVYGNCPNANPTTAGPDYDFAQGPMWLGGGLIGAGQKSGKFWAFDHKTGALAWATQVAPGGVTGGLQWGSATDGHRIFVAVSNSGPSTNGGGRGAAEWTLKDGTTTKAGGWAALDRKTGAVLWTTPDPGGWVNDPTLGSGNRAEAAVSATDSVVFGCNLAAGKGTMYALNAKSGEVLWSYDSGGPCNAGPSIANGMVFWGSGTFVSPGGPKKVFAFGL